MEFNNHDKLKGKHAFLSASNYHWLNYDQKKLIQTYSNQLAKARGTKLHALAHDLNVMNVKLPKSRKTFNTFVNDSIGYNMTPEITLFHSDECFGTADALSFRNNLLRIHDLKTGVTPASMEQLMIYAALFCFEYHKKPKDIRMELRIYQNDEIVVHEPSTEEIEAIMDKISEFSKILQRMKQDSDFDFDSVDSIINEYGED